MIRGIEPDGQALEGTPSIDIHRRKRDLDQGNSEPVDRKTTST